MSRLVILLVVCLSLPAYAAPVQVVASFSILADWVRVVGGERVQVHSLVGPGQDVHDWQPSPATARQIAGARLLVANGLGLDDPVQKLARASGFRGQLLIASRGISALPLHGDDGHAHHAHDGHDHSAGFDPHAWQDLRLVSRYIGNITEALAQADAGGAAYYRQRASAYQAELQRLDQWAQAQFAVLRPEQRRALVSHDAFAYFARRFGLTLIPVQGKSGDAQTSARSVAALLRQIRSTGLKAVFLENTNNARLTVQIARETGVQPGGELYADSLSAPGGPASDFLSFYRHNVLTLVAGMRRN